LKNKLTQPREPLHNLKLILEQKLGADLSDYDFWLQVEEIIVITVIVPSWMFFMAPMAVVLGLQQSSGVRIHRIHKFLGLPDKSRIRILHSVVWNCRSGTVYKRHGSGTLLFNLANAVLLVYSDIFFLSSS
jgi:hypothetical protein